MGIIKKIISGLYNARMGFSKRTGIGVTVLSDITFKKPIEPFYNLSAITNNGSLIRFSEFAGKKVLIVNVASECGFTPQYKELEKLQKMGLDNFVVLGFPSNDFGGQEPGSDKNIAEFCEINFGVTFQLFSKGKVIGQARQPVYEWLTNPLLNGWNSQPPTWNFCKYFVDEKGKLSAFYSSSVSPLSNDIVKAIST